MSLVGFEPTIATTQRPQTYTLDRAATGTGIRCFTLINNLWHHVSLKMVEPKHDDAKSYNTKTAI
jgi:hypothetical protein